MSGDEAVNRWLENEFGPRMVVAEGAPIQSAIDDFLSVAQSLEYAVVGCACLACQTLPTTVEECDEALLVGAYWIKMPNVIFGSPDCAMINMVAMHRALGWSLRHCDLCGSPKAVPELAQVVGKILIVMMICPACAGHPHANAHLN